jgi:hypothetical protein
LEYNKTLNGQNTVLTGTKFAFPGEAAGLYYLTLAAGFGGIFAGQRLLSFGYRHLLQTDRLASANPSFFYNLGVFIDVGTCLVNFLGAFLFVYLYRFNYYVPLALRSSLDWQLETGGMFFGIVTLLALIPGTAIGLALTNFLSMKKVGLSGRSRIIFILTIALAALSMFGLTFAFLATVVP